MGLFSKKQYADTLYINGRIETLDPDFPDAEAIAVKDGVVLALGDTEDVEAFANRDTETVDLEGACVVPGFFTMNSTLIRDAYSSFAQPLSDQMSADEVLRTIRKFLSINPKDPAYLAFGYYDGLDFGPDAARVLLDAISPQKPLVVLSASGASALVNTAALTAAHSALEEELKAMEAAGEVRLVPQGRSSAADAVLRTKTDEGIDVDGEYDDEYDENEPEAFDGDGADPSDGKLDLEEIRRKNPWFLFRDILPGFQYFDRDENGVPTGRLEGPSTISQFMNLLGAFDETALAKAVVDASIRYAKKGYTTLLDGGSPDYFVRGFMSTATDLLQSGLALQRNIVTTFVPKETDAYLAIQRMNQKETLCVECADLLSAAAVCFDVRSGGPVANDPNAADGGDPADDPSAGATLSPAFLEDYATRSLDHGFDVLAVCDGPAAANAALEGLGAAREKARKGKLVVRLSELSDEEEATFRDDFDTAGIPVIGEPKTPAQILSVLTGRSRHLLRAYETAGRIAVGENADFTVLQYSPFGETEETSEDPRNIPVLYTVLAGRIVSTDPADYELPSFDEYGEEFEEEN